MISIDLKTFIEEYWEAISGFPKTPALLRRYIVDDDLIGHVMAFEASFPCYELIADEMICEADKVSVIGRFKGTHEGEIMGMAATGKKVNIPFSVIYQVEYDKIVKSWLFLDQMELMRQLGLMNNN